MENRTSIKNQVLDSIKLEITKELDCLDIDCKENLIEKGLSSIMIMKISNKLRKSGIRISFAKLMETPTIKDWERLIESSKISNKKETNLKSIQKELYDEEFPLTDVQYAYWVGREDDQVLGGVGCHAYLEIDGENIDAIKLNNSWNILQNSHPMLRAKFTKQGTQKIMQTPYSNQISVYDLKLKDEYEIKEKLKYIRNTLSHRKLKIEDGEVAGLSIALLPNNKSRIFLDVDLLVADVMSLSIIIDDLANIYNGESKLIDSTYSFKNYIQEREINNKSYDEDKAYWQEKIDSLPKETPSLPLNKKPELVKNIVFNRRREVIDKEIWNKIKMIAGNYKATPSMVLLACYSLILERWINQDKFIINMPLFNRDTENDNLSNMIADFTNLLLVDYERNANETFLKTVKKVSQTFLENVSHSSYSGVQVQRDIYKDIGVNNNIAPIVFACNIDYPLETEVSKQLFGKINYMISQTPQVWLDFQTYIVDDNLVLCWDAVEELYPEGLLDDMFSSLVSLIYNLSKHNDWNKIFDVLPDNQKIAREKELLDILHLEYPKKTLYSDFITNVENTPDKVAVIDAETGEEITYKHLYDKALNIASILVENGVKKGDYIGITLPRGFDQIYAIFGTLFAGAAYVPIGINQPKDRRKKIYKQIGINYIISNLKTINDFSLIDEDIISIDIDIISSIQYKLDKPVDINPQDTSYVIMTSGTTGVPKGVEICHQNAVNTILDINYKYSIDSKDSIIMVSAIDFDLSVYDIFGLLSAGGKIITLNEDNFKDPDLWIELIQKYQITLWDSVPILFDMLVTMAEGKDEQLPLRVIMLSGDWIAINLPSRFYDRSQDSIVVAMGGATEASIWSNYMNVPKEIPKDWISIPYGKALKNQVYRIVDDFGRICPNYVKGELLIGGAGVAKCYRGDEELTNNKFIYDGIRWYKTGDNGRTWNDGIIEFLGRKDSQVKVKGHRIELGEIEDAIKSYDGVKNVVVDCISKKGTDKSIVALVELEKQEFNKNKEIYDDVKNKNYQSICNEIDKSYKNKSGFNEFLGDCNKLCFKFILDTFKKLGITFDSNKYSIEYILSNINILEENKHIVKTWIDILVKNSIIQQQGEIFTLSDLYSKDLSLNDNMSKNLINIENYLISLEDKIVPILDGRIDPIEFFYKDSLSMKPNDILKEFIGYKDTEKRLELILNGVFNTITHDKINVLEIGTRDKKLTEQILNTLDHRACRYIYADESIYFKNEMDDLYSNYKHLEYYNLGVNNDLNSKIDDESIDVVIFINSLHRNKEVMKSLSNSFKSNTILIGSEIYSECILGEIIGRLLNRKSNKDRRLIPNVSEIKGIIENSDFNICYITNESNSKTYGDRVFLAVNNKFTQSDIFKNITKFIEDKIPSYMMPSMFYKVDKFPITNNGKLDRKFIKNQILNNLKSNNTKKVTVAKETKIEEDNTNLKTYLTNLWSTLLNLNSLSSEDNYFSLGGDSLIATQMMSEIKKEYGLDLSIKTIFENSTINDLSKLLFNKLNKEGELNKNLIKIEGDKVNENEPFALTDVQLAYWIGRSGGYYLGNVSTHCYFEFDLDNLDTNKLEYTFNMLIKHHGMMRNIILPNGMQQILDKVPYYEIDIFDFSDVNEANVNSELIKLREKMSHQVIDIETWPLFDVKVSKKLDDKHRVHISFDNIVFDGWSMFYILEQWQELYEGKIQNLKDIKISYRDYVICLEKIKQSQQYFEDEKYWEHRIPNFSKAPQLPIQKEEKELTLQHFTRREFLLSKKEWETLKLNAEKSNITISVLLISAYSEVLRIWSENKNFTINITRFDRKDLHNDINKLVGDFTSLTLLEIKDMEDKDFVSKMNEIQKQLLNDISHSLYSAIDIERNIRKNSNNIRGSIMPIVFTSGIGISESNSNKWLNNLNYSISQTPQVWLDHQVMEVKEGLYLSWDSIDELFGKELLDSMFNLYKALILKLASCEDISTIDFKSLLKEQYVVKTNPLKRCDCDELIKEVENKDKEMLISFDDDIQIKVISIFKEILDIESILEDSNFFEIGGDSLRAIKLINRLCDEFKIRINIRDLFINPTPIELSNLINEKCLVLEEV